MDVSVSGDMVFTLKQLSEERLCLILFSDF